MLQPIWWIWCNGKLFQVRSLTDRILKLFLAKDGPLPWLPINLKILPVWTNYPKYLEKDVKSDTLNIYCNGEINYTIKGKHAKVSVIWNYKAPEGTGDTHQSIMRGSKSDLIIEQGAAENYKPTLYVVSRRKL